MSEKLAQLNKKGGGGGTTERVIWTNPSPSSSMGSVIYQLSESVNNFDYIKVKYKVSLSNSSEGFVMMTVSDFLNTEDAQDVCNPAMFVRIKYSGTAYYCYRGFAYSSSQSGSIAFINPIRVSGSSSYNASTYLIPLQVIGIKMS